MASATLHDLGRTTDSRTTSPFEVRQALIEGREIALLDVREEAFHAQGHPLFAANLTVSRLELDARVRLPRADVPIVLFGDGEGLAELAAQRLKALGYTDVSLLAGGLQGWSDAGYEIFHDVNSPSKAFGELVEARRHTPSLSAEEVQRLIRERADILIVDARRYEEFQTMSIPTAVSAPGGELVYRVQALVERPTTQVIVNCAGRTRSIVGTQSLINAGLSNPVAALRNGTIGWKLAGQELDHGAVPRAGAPDEATRVAAAAAARRVADAAGVRRADLEQVEHWRAADDRTVYLFDVRTPEEYAAGHLPHFRSAPGGQLVQETDMFAPVRGARIVLVDADGARANMTASWLAQMNWDVAVVDGLSAETFVETRGSAAEVDLPLEVPSEQIIMADELAHRLVVGGSDGVAVLDFSRSRAYLKQRIPGSWFALRSRLQEALETTSESQVYVVTADEEAAARLAWSELRGLTSKQVLLLVGGTRGWAAAGHRLEAERPRFASQPVDYYERPYEGTQASAEAMQGYLDWEYGLVAQLRRDGTHGFWVLEEQQGADF